MIVRTNVLALFRGPDGWVLASLAQWVRVSALHPLCASLQTLWLRAVVARPLDTTGAALEVMRLHAVAPHIVVVLQGCARETLGMEEELAVCTRRVVVAKGPCWINQRYPVVSFVVFEANRPQSAGPGLAVLDDSVVYEQS